MSTIALADVDLFFRAKIEALLAGTGHELLAASDGASPDLVIADVNRGDPEAVRERFPDARVLGFGAHTDAAALRRARAAGFARAVPRSVLAARLPDLVEEVLYTPPASRPRPEE